MGLNYQLKMSYNPNKAPQPKLAEALLVMYYKNLLQTPDAILFCTITLVRLFYLKFIVLIFLKFIVLIFLSNKIQLKRP